MNKIKVGSESNDIYDYGFSEQMQLFAESNLSILACTSSYYKGKSHEPSQAELKNFQLELDPS